ncbi:MAG TPA: ABC transporter ATP-binding protein [Bacteroidia bacterium]|nr:ABC transporter ATP-binding protein [Bacteroidia bacterium]HNT79073.1 ABC transporter ATP-binding protein [Bacteroidia bacterium]
MKEYKNKKGSLPNAIHCLREHLAPFHKKRAALLSVVICLSAVLDVFGLASILPLIQLAADMDAIHTNPYLNTMYTYLGFSEPKTFLLTLMLCTLLFFVLKNVFGLLVNFMQTRFSADVATYLSKNQFSKYYSFDLNRFQSIKSSIIINHVYRNPLSFCEYILMPVIMLFSESVIFLLIITGIAIYNIDLFLFTSAVVIPTSFIIYYSIRSTNARIGREIDANYPKALAALTHAIDGYVDIKLFNKESYYGKRFVDAQFKLHNLHLKSYFLNMVPLRANEIVALLGVVSIFIYAIFFTNNQSQVILFVGLFAAAAYRLMPSLTRILNSLLFIKKNQVAIDNLNIYNKWYKQELANERHEKIEFEKSISFDKVTYHFPESDVKVIDELTFTVNKGETIGFVGSSGSGKTTLMNLLLGFHEPVSGDIMIDDIALNKTYRKHWRSMIGYVKQDVFMVDGSIKENIAFGENEVDEVKLKSAIKQASLDKFIDSLPQGWDTPVGEKGSRLSGGQKQRMGIARALYNNAQILVFDEATSALDVETENEVTEAINSLTDHNRTILIIAHRITTLKRCDRIYELKEGKISAVYQYRELIEKVL